MGFDLLREGVTEVSPDEVRQVQLRVCGAAKDVAEAREMLDFLGLLPAKQMPEKPEHFELCVRWKHRMTPENTLPGERGGRKCKACQVNKAKEAALRVVVDAPPGKNQHPDFCKNGHLKAEHGYYVRANGQRECRKCREDRRVKENSDRLAKRIGPRRKVCVNGHPFTEESTRYHPKGKRACGICQDARKKSLTT